MKRLPLLSNQPLMPPYVNMIHFGIVLFFAATLNFKLCLSICARAEYKINGECCPMCAPGNHVLWHCTVDTSTTCVPCSALTYIDEPNGLDKCFPCSVCAAEQGLGIKRSCTRFANAVCEPLDGFYCIEQNKGSCRFTVKHSECHPGQYIRQAGTAFTDTVCADCTEGTYSNGSFTTCQPHSICESEGLKEIKPGSMSSDVECGKSLLVPIIVAVIAVVIIGVLVTAVGIKIYSKLKQKRQPPNRVLDPNGYSTPIPESNPAVMEERPVPEGACEPTSPDSVTPLITRNSSDIIDPETSPKSHSEKASQQNTVNDLSFVYHSKDYGMESEAKVIMSKEKHSAQNTKFNMDIL